MPSLSSNFLIGERLDVRFFLVNYQDYVVLPHVGEELLVVQGGVGGGVGVLHENENFTHCQCGPDNGLPNALLVDGGRQGDLKHASPSVPDMPRLGHFD